MARMIWTRQRRREVTNVAQIYPQRSGGDLGSDRTVGRATQEDREPRAIRCYQCGQPVEDYAEIETCPFCESDNMLGKQL